MHASSGILFNHESPRRGHEFVTRKITAGVARILAGQATELRLGNLDAERDWGFAKEYVDAMWRMLQQPVPDDYVIATGKLHSVRDFVRIAFQCGGLDWEKYVVTDPNFFRSGESVALCGDATKARNVLGWEPKKQFEEMIREMVETDCLAMGVTLPAAAR
jgi:GDPmannose 4,6-dehydratase